MCACCAAQLTLVSFPSAFAKAPFNSFITDPTRSGNGYSIVNSLIRCCEAALWFSIPAYWLLYTACWVWSRVSVTLGRAATCGPLSVWLPKMAEPSPSPSSNGRGCGARVRGSNAIIQNNNVSYVALDSYNAAPGFDGSMEGGFAQNVTVRISQARFGRLSQGRLHGGA